jgi:uncharacterized coiled-coil protein SlyX
MRVAEEEIAKLRGERDAFQERITELETELAAKEQSLEELHEIQDELTDLETESVRPLDFQLSELSDNQKYLGLGVAITYTLLARRLDVGSMAQVVGAIACGGTLMTHVPKTHRPGGRTLLSATVVTGVALVATRKSLTLTAAVLGGVIGLCVSAYLGFKAHRDRWLSQVRHEADALYVRYHTLNLIRNEDVYGRPRTKILLESYRKKMRYTVSNLEFREHKYKPVSYSSLGDDLTTKLSEVELVLYYDALHPRTEEAELMRLAPNDHVPSL